MGPNEEPRNIEIDGVPFNGKIPTMNVIRVSPCPFCKSERVKPQKFGTVKVCCEACGTIGPVAASVEQAVELWNKAEEKGA